MAITLKPVAGGVEYTFSGPMPKTIVAPQEITHDLLQKQVDKQKSKTKKKVQSKQVSLATDGQQTLLLEPEQSAIVDEYVLLKRDLAELEEKRIACDSARKDLLKIASDFFAPDKSVAFMGNKSSCTFTEATDLRTVNDMHGLIGALKTAIGYDNLLQLLKINLTDAEKYLGKAELEKYVVHGPGHRTIGSYQVFEDEL